MSEVKGAQRARRATGLYHTAILVPSKWELAQLLNRIAQTHTRIQGMTNHGTHLAIYLPDAEGNGLELAWDFPREKWQPIVDATRRGDPDAMLRAGGPLEPEELFAVLKQEDAPWAGLHPATHVGHVHLHVADLRATRWFYHDVLGFDVIIDSDRMGAVFVSAGGYHHHIGGNIWHGIGAPPPPPTRPACAISLSSCPTRPSWGASRSASNRQASCWSRRLPACSYVTPRRMVFC